jgi:hypothetical protein
LKKLFKFVFIPAGLVLKSLCLYGYDKLMKHRIDVCNILCWRTLHTTIEPFSFHFTWTVFMTIWHERVRACHSIHISDMHMCAVSICQGVALLLGHSGTRTMGALAARSKCHINSSTLHLHFLYVILLCTQLTPKTASVVSPEDGRLTAKTCRGLRHNKVIVKVKVY